MDDLYGKLKYFVAIFVVPALMMGFQFSVASAPPPGQQYVIMLSMDGFRWDYAARVETPFLDFIAGNGVMAEYVIPAFPNNRHA